MERRGIRLLTKHGNQIILIGDCIAFDVDPVLREGDQYVGIVAGLIQRFVQFEEDGPIIFRISPNRSPYVRATGRHFTHYVIGLRVSQA